MVHSRIWKTRDVSVFPGKSEETMGTANTQHLSFLPIEEPSPTAGKILLGSRFVVTDEDEGAKCGEKCV